MYHSKYLKNENQHIVVWLLSILFLVISMIIIGGITRITDSGLSMVEWRPLFRSFTTFK